MGTMKFNFDYCGMLLDHMSGGKSYHSFAGVIKVARSTLDRWEKHIPEWKQAKEIGQMCLLNAWEDIVIGQAQGDIKGAPASTIFALKNLLPDSFKENTQLQGQGGVTVVIDTGVPRAIEANSYEMDENGNQIEVQNTLTLAENDKMPLGSDSLPKGLSFREDIIDVETEKPLDGESKGDDISIEDEL